MSTPYGSAAVNWVVSFNLPPGVFSAASTSTHERTEFNGKGARSAGNNGTRVDALPTLQWQAGTLLKKPIAAPRVRWVTARHLRTSWGPTAANYKELRRPLIYFSSKSKINKLPIQVSLSVTFETILYEMFHFWLPGGWFYQRVRRLYRNDVITDNTLSGRHKRAMLRVTRAITHNGLPCSTINPTT